MIREMVYIDEEKCDGCGECVPACQEGAIQVINGKARLIADNLCDGLGACLGHCPQDAIRIERREADAYDEAAVAAHLRSQGQAPAASASPSPAPPSGCPSARFIQLGDPAPRPSAAAAEPGSRESAPSVLGQWPVQLRLLPPQAPMLRGADLLLSADCVPYALADFHPQLLSGRALAVACPKLDDPTGYVEKLAEMIRGNDLQRITVARMEVPCCGGILMMAVRARQLAGTSVPIRDIVISTRGEVIADREVPEEMVL
jgi:NAD-dependent dihydropyrimidine dehydrogenase PreA subunit